MKTERELFETWYRANFENADYDNRLNWNDGAYTEPLVNLLYKGWLASTQADRWVSVDDDIPEEWEDVLVLLDNGEIIVDYLVSGAMFFRCAEEQERTVKFWARFNKFPERREIS